MDEREESVVVVFAPDTHLRVVRITDNDMLVAVDVLLAYLMIRGFISRRDLRSTVSLAEKRHLG